MHLHDKFTFKISFVKDKTFLMVKVGDDRWECYGSNLYPNGPHSPHFRDNIVERFGNGMWIDYQELSDKWEKRVERMSNVK